MVESVLATHFLMVAADSKHEMGNSTLRVFMLIFADADFILFGPTPFNK